MDIEEKQSFHENETEFSNFKIKEHIFLDYLTLKRNLIVDICTYYFINTIYYCIFN